MTTATQRQLTRLELFRSLIKDGCKWHGDTMSRKWAEVLDAEDDHTMERVKQTLSLYIEDIDYRVEHNSIFIA